ncbi:hypothetical protein CXF85_12685, partial [Colwellia sp. 75C3]|uniref:beta strand repeat-containing protein n=1 Tax=Colwellia sp. 75C3 TaxID=888425 RepID=UPI000CC6D3A0
MPIQKQKSTILNISLFFMVFLLSFVSNAEPYPPLWNNGTGSAIHFEPVAWPSEPNDAINCAENCGEWKPYTRFQNQLADPRTKDPSNGGTSPQSYVNVASSCIDKSLPSIYYSMRQGTTEADDVLMFRWRVEAAAHTYATGKNSGSAGATAPWSSALWTVFFDLGGSGYRSLAAHLNGSSGSPAKAIDLISGIWGDTSSHSLDYVNDPNIHLLGHNPTAFIGDNDKILNFADSLTPTENWPNGAAETSWDYGTTRAKVVTHNSCTEYFIDYQIPIKMLDASEKFDSSGKKGPNITRDTPISMMFCSANSLNNPLQKDCAIGKKWLADPSVAAPFGDYLSFNQSKPYSQPIISSVDVVSPNTCPGTYELNATVQDTLALQDGVVIPSVKSVDFYYWYDANGDGQATAADTDSEWIKTNTTGALDAGTLNSWSASWDATSLPKGKFLIGVQALDDNSQVDDGMVASGIDNRTISYLSGDSVNEIYIAGSWVNGQESLFPQHSPVLANSSSENWYGNPAVTGQQIAILGTAINACGLAPTISLTADATSVAGGGTVGYSVVVSNPSNNNSAIVVSNIIDVLPDGFSYQSSSTAGVPVEPSESGQTLTWTLSSPVSLAAGESLTLSFDATASTVSGTYNNNAYSLTSFGDLESSPVAISVDSARMSLAIIPSSFSVAADGIEEITFFINYANDSVVPVTNASITSTLPSGINYVICAAGLTCDLSGNEITWDLGSLAAGISGSVSYTVTVANTWSLTSLTSSALLSVTAPDSSIIDNNASTKVAVTGLSVTSPALMTLSVAADVIQADAGGTIEYTLTYKNDGDTTANNVIVNNTIAEGLTYFSCSTSCSESNGVASWNLASVAAGASGSVTLTVNVSDPFTALNPTTDQATIDWTDGVQVNAEVNVGINGQTCNSYYFTDIWGDVGFDGSGSVGNDSVIQRLAKSSPIPTASDTGGSVTITAPSKSGNAFIEAIRFYQSPISTQDVSFAGGSLTSTVFVDRANGKAVNLRVSVYDYDTITGDRVAIAAPVVDSFGGSTTGALTTTIVPTGILKKNHILLWVYEAQSNHNSQTLQAQFQYGGTVVNGVSNGSVDASIASSTFCVTPPANLVLSTSVDDTSIAAASTPTLTYTQTYANSGQLPADNSQLVANLPSGFTGCQYLTDSSIWNTCSATVSHTFSLGTVLAGGSGTVYLKGEVAAGTAGGDILTANSSITSNQTASVTASAETAVIGDNGGGSSAVAELALSLSADKSSLKPSDTIIYTLTVTNIGGADATGVAIANTLPVADYFQYSACSDSCLPSGNDISWTLGNLAAGASKTYTYSMTVSTSNLLAGITVINDDATATGSALSSVTSNLVAVAITGNPLLDITVTASPNTSLSPNGEVAYDIEVVNNGSVSATSVKVVTPIPANIQFVGAITSSVGTGSFDTINNSVVYTLGDLASSATASLSFKGKVSNNLSSGNTTATFISTVSAANALNAIGTATISADAAPVLTLLKTQTGTTAYPAATVTADVSNSTRVYVNKTDQFSLNQLIKVDGIPAVIVNISSNSLELDRVVTATSGTDIIGSITFSMSYKNTGNATATNVSLTDILAAELTYYASSPNANSAPTIGNSGDVSWYVGDLAAGEFTTKRVTVFPNGSQGSFTSTATVSADNAADASASVVTSIGGLVIEKSTSTRYVATGGVATYQIKLTNSLASDINNISVTDILVNGFSYQVNSATVGGVSTEPSFDGADVSNSQPIWSNLTVAANRTLIISFNVDVSNDMGATTYQNELDIVLPNNIGLQPFQPLTTTAEDVTILGDGYGVITGYVFNRLGASGNSYVAGKDTALANVQVNIHQDGDDCSNVYSAGCFIALTNNSGYFEQVVKVGDWYLEVQPGSGDLNATWSQTVGDNDNLVTVVSQGFIGDHNGFADVTSHIVNASAEVGGAIDPASRVVVDGETTTFTITPDVNYNINTVIGCNGTLSGGTYTTDTIIASCSVSASFTPITHTVTALAGTGGGISPATQTVNQGTTTVITVTPTSGYFISAVTGCDGSLSGNTYTTGTIAASCSVSASFTPIAG